MARKKLLSPKEQADKLLQKYKTIKEAIYSAEYMLEISKVCKSKYFINYWSAVKLELN
jgi:hypothetical protein